MITAQQLYDALAKAAEELHPGQQHWIAEAKKDFALAHLYVKGVMNFERAAELIKFNGWTPISTIPPRDVAVDIWVVYPKYETAEREANMAWLGWYWGHLEDGSTFYAEGGVVTHWRAAPQPPEK